MRDEIDQRAQLTRHDGALIDALTFLVEAPEQLINHPVCRGLSVTPFGNRFEVIGRGHLCR